MGRGGHRPEYLSDRGIRARTRAGILALLWMRPHDTPTNGERVTGEGTPMINADNPLAYRDEEFCYLTTSGRRSGRAHEIELS